MMLSLELPCGQVFAWQSPTASRPLFGGKIYPCEFTLWLGWFVYRCTWYPTNVRGQEAFSVNNRVVWSVKP